MGCGCQGTGQGAAGWPLGGAAGMPHAGHRWFQPSPTNPQHSTAQPLGPACGALGICTLKRGKNTTQTVRSEKCVRNSPTNTKTREGGAGGTTGTQADVPLQRITENQVFPCSPWRGLHQGSHLHCSHGGKKPRKKKGGEGLSQFCHCFSPSKSLNW